MTNSQTFRKTYLEITSTCNLACDFCPGTSRPGKYLELSRANHYIATLAPISGVMHLHVMGEPLSHPDFKAILDLCAIHRARLNIVTNGTLLTHHTHTLLTSPAVQQISISVHSLEANPVPADSTYSDQLLTFIKHQHRPPISLRLWNREQSLQSVTTDTILSALCLAGHFKGTPAELTATLRRQGYLKLNESLFINTAERFEWPDLTQPELSTTGHCPALASQIAILVDGTVVPCCLDRNGVTPLGNLETQSLPEILASPKAVKMRTGFSDGLLTEPLCRRCTFRTRFDR
jgi:radical SAM protein with 4Fe4S-binding SPASM domain